MDPHKLLLKLLDRINLNRSYKYVALLNLSVCYIWKNIKRSYKKSIFAGCLKKRNRITFKIKTRYYLKFLTPETIKLLLITKYKINKDENGENVPHLEIREVLIIYFNILNNDYQQDSRALYAFICNKSFKQFLDISPKTF